MCSIFSGRVLRFHTLSFLHERLNIDQEYGITSVILRVYMLQNRGVSYLNIFCKPILLGSTIKIKEVYEALFYIHETRSKRYLKTELLSHRKHI